MQRIKKAYLLSGGHLDNMRTALMDRTGDAPELPMMMAAVDYAAVLECAPKL
jgi:hypothetical protein